MQMISSHGIKKFILFIYTRDLEPVINTFIVCVLDTFFMALGIKPRPVHAGQAPYF
jgi:hypothetical protein